MAGFREFGKRMQKHGENVERNASALVRKCALAVDATVVLATPVDEGRARANWQVALGGPASGEIDPYAPGKGGSSGAANASAALAQGKAVIATHTKGAIHVTNNLPYIGRLNDGYSAQAPAGFVQTAVLAGVKAVRGAQGIITGDFKDG